MSPLPFATEATPPTGPRDDEQVSAPRETELERCLAAMARKKEADALYEARQNPRGVGRSEVMSYPSLQRRSPRASPVERARVLADWDSALIDDVERDVRLEAERGVTLCACGRVSQRADEPCSACVEGGR